MGSINIKKHYNYLLIASLIIGASVFSGCQKVINIDLNEASPHIVIEGMITDSIGPYRVIISNSGSYFSQLILPPVSGALAIISDSKGTIDTLKETIPGIYLTSKIQGIPGLTYTLIVLSENKEYTAISTMHSHVDIDSLVLEKGQSRGFGFGGGNRDTNNVDIYCYFKDPEEKNYYRIKVYNNDSTNLGNYRLYDDQYTPGEVTNLRVTRATAGHNYLIELYSLDLPTYEYYRTLEDILRTNPIFGSTPANPNTNLNNGALGYFGVSAVSYKTIAITDSMLNSLK